MTTRRPRTVLAAAIGTLIVVLALLAVALLRADATERRDAERRFNDKSRVTAGLTSSLFSATSGQAEMENARRFGGEQIDPARLRAVARQSRLAYALVVDSRGIVLGLTGKAPKNAFARLANPPKGLKDVMTGAKPIYLSDVIDGSPDLVEFALGFDTGSGRRAIVQGFPTQILSLFFNNYLAEIPDSKASNAYVLDAAGRVVGSAVEDQPTGELAQEPGLLEAIKVAKPTGKFDGGGDERYFVETPIANSSWRVVISTSTATLYQGVSSIVQWLTLFGLALAGIFAVIALGRAARAAAAVAEANTRLADSNAELERSNVELQRSNAELEQFASVASHDLQEPLRKVQTFGDQLERRFAEELPDEAVDYLRRMRKSAGRMSTLIEDLLRFSRVTTHARPPEKVDLNVVARDVVADLETAIAESHGHVEIEHLPTVEADPLQMRQLMQNLIANGIKFHRPGISPEVTVRTVQAPAGSLAFAVSDNGIGFESKYQERIFRVFERLHPRDVFEGTGIGLALCRKIAERHGGTIEGQGRPDEGSTFTVTLPARAPVQPATAPSGGANGNGNGNARPPERETAHV